MKIFLAAILALLTAACQDYTLRDPLCDPQQKSLPADLEGIYQLTTMVESDVDSLVVPGKQILEIRPRDGVIRTGDWEDSTSRIVWGTLAPNTWSFCSGGSGELYLQTLEESTYTWTVSRLQISPSGFSVRPLAYHPDRLTALGIRFLLVDLNEPQDSSESRTARIGNRKVIVDNRRKANGQPVAAQELLQAAFPLSLGMHFQRIEETPQVRKRLARGGRSFSLQR